MFVGSLAVTIATVFWTAGSWVQDKWIAAFGEVAFIRIGFVVMMPAILVVAVTASSDLPYWLIHVAWALGGFGIGLASAAHAELAMRSVADDEIGMATSSLQLAGHLGMALGAGAVGVIVAYGGELGWSPGYGRRDGPDHLAARGRARSAARAPAARPAVAGRGSNGRRGGGQPTLTSRTLEVVPCGRWTTRPDGGRRALKVGLIAVVTLVAFESLAVITILPDIEDDLGGIAWYGWVTTAFFLGTMIGIVYAGDQADRRGAARPYVRGLLLFAVGLVVAGLAPSMPVLVLAGSSRASAPASFRRSATWRSGEPSPRPSGRACSPCCRRRGSSPACWGRCWPSGCPNSPDGGGCSSG